MGEIVQVANVIVPVVLCILVGFGLAKARAPFDGKMVSSLVANVGYPALILSNLENTAVSVETFMTAMFATAIVAACFAAIGLIFLLIMGLSPRAFLSPMMFNNAGNVGLPICSLAFGELGLVYALAFFIVVLVGIFSVGIWIPSGKVSFREIAGKPVVYAVLIVLVLMGTSTRLPTVLDSALSILGGMAIPLMLLMLGHTLASLKAGNLWRGTYLALFHLVMAIGVAFGITELFGFEGTERGAMILLCMMPVAIATHLWIETYRPDDAPDVAAFIMVSTLLAVISLPLALILWV